MSAKANMPAAVISCSAALAALLRAATESETESCSAVTKLLHGFLRSFDLAALLQHSPSAVPLVDRFWQQVSASPSGLAATVEALQARHASDSLQLDDILRVGQAVRVHLGFLAPGLTSKTLWLRSAARS